MTLNEKLNKKLADRISDVKSWEVNDKKDEVRLSFFDSSTSRRIWDIVRMAEVDGKPLFETSMLLQEILIVKESK